MTKIAKTSPHLNSFDLASAGRTKSRLEQVKAGALELEIYSVI